MTVLTPLADPPTVVEAVLKKEGSPTHNRVGGNVWCPLPPSTLFKNKQPAIVFSGTEVYDGGIYTCRYQFRSYGGSLRHFDTRKTFRALIETLMGHPITVNQIHGIITAFMETSIPDTVEQDTGYPVHVSMWQLRIV